MTALANIDTSNARLPAAYEAAKTALANCVDVDECKGWADKSAALKSYAKQVNDPTLYKHAARIQVHATRRMGELLKTFDGRGNNQHTEDRAGDLPTQKEAAKEAGLSEHQQKQAVRIANIPVEEFEQAVESYEPPTVTKLATMGKAKANAKDRAEVKAKAATIAPPVGLYRTIVIDPPWDMKKIDRDVRPNQVGFDYPTMSLAEIAAVNVPSTEAAHCYLWTTQKYLPASLDILAGWGFDYLVTMVWHKSGGFQPVGLPQYNCEFVLLGRKQGLAFLDTKAFPTCFEAPRREHGRKPTYFYDLVRRVSPGPRLDMFSREYHDGFDQWGAETDKFVEAA